MTHYIYVFTGKKIHMWGRNAYGFSAGSIMEFVYLMPQKLRGNFTLTTIWMEAPVPEEDLLWFDHLEKMG